MENEKSTESKWLQLILWRWGELNSLRGLNQEKLFVQMLEHIISIGKTSAKAS
jgi:hypothetical protein